jgi:hypothetical protein
VFFVCQFGAPMAVSGRASRKTCRSGSSCMSAYGPYAGPWLEQHIPEFVISGSAGALTKQSLLFGWCQNSASSVLSRFVSWAANNLEAANNLAEALGVAAGHTVSSELKARFKLRREVYMS